MVGTPGKLIPRAARFSICCDHRSLALASGCRSANACQRLPRAAVVASADSSNPRLYFNPRSMASENERCKDCDERSAEATLPKNGLVWVKTGAVAEGCCAEAASGSNRIIERMQQRFFCKD